VKYSVAAAYFDLYKFLHFYDLLDAEIETEKKQLTVIESLHRNGIVLKSDAEDFSKIVTIRTESF
jgi:hypothetical protein